MNLLKTLSAGVVLALSLAAGALAQPVVINAPGTNATPLEISNYLVSGYVANTPALKISGTWDSKVDGASQNLIQAYVTNTSSHGASRLMSLATQENKFEVMKTGEVIVTRVMPGDDSLGGMRVVGNNGEMALTSQVDASTGRPAELLRWYWEDSSKVGPVAGSAAVLRGMGTNRFSIESAGAMVHVAANSRYEWEGFTSPTINFIGYEAGSSNGRPINFDNTGQTAEKAVPIMATNRHSTVANIAEFRDGTSGPDPVVRASIATDGRVNASSLNLSNVPTADPHVPGDVWNDGGVMMISGG